MRRDPELEKSLDLTGLREVFPDHDWYSPESVAAREDYDSIESLLTELRNTRREKGLTQADVAAKMETTQSAVSELESFGSAHQVDTLQRYARAIGMKLVLQAKPAKPAARRKSA